ncbi:MAG TPA: LamG domain-containing protein [Verrucomicrobiae bacterium]
MKSFRIFSFVTTLSVVILLAAQAQEPPTAGLLAYYPLDGDANDASGNGLNGTTFNGVSYVSHLGALAVQLNSSNLQYITLPGSISNYQDLSVTFWLKTGVSTPNAFYSDYFVISRDIAGFTYDWNICLGRGRKIEFHTGLPTEVGPVLASVDNLGSNEWTHVACVADSVTGTRRIFLNGVESASASWVPHPFANNGTPIWVGNASAGANLHPYFDGDIDELRIYSRALAAYEVQQLFNSLCSPHAATATAVTVNGFVVGATILEPGCGYPNAPAVSIRGGGGSGATAYAQVSGGFVTNIVITSTGSGYVSVPEILIASPPFTPWLTIGVNTVKVVQHVVLNNTYALESSFNLIDWVQQGTNFTATSEVITNSFDVDQTGRFFRIRQVP